MDFIELLFGISPDGGDGTVEALWIAAIAAVVAGVVFRTRIAAFAARMRKR